MAIPVLNDTKKFSYRYSWIHLARPLTLSGTISPMLAGTAYAAHRGTINIKHFVILLIATMLIQIATNIFNDYYDFKHGQDQQKWTDKKRSRLTPAHKQLPFVATGLLLVSAICGVWLALETEFGIIFIGVLGVLFGISYSAGKYALSSIGLGETVAALFLGLIPTILAYFIQTHHIDVVIILLGLPFAFIISTMILTNNIRDIEKDNHFRHTIAIMVGRKWAKRLLNTLLLFAYLSVVLLIFVKIIPSQALAVFFAIPFAIRLRHSFRKRATKEEEMAGMKWASYHHWAFGLLLAAALWVTI